MNINVKLLAIFVLLFSTASYSGEQKPFDKTLQKVASDLSTLQQEIQSAYQKQVVNAAPDDWGISSKSVAVTTEKGKVFAGADENSQVIRNVPKGKTFAVIDKTNGWYAVTLDEPVDGVRTGWLNAAEVVPEFSSESEGLGAVGAYRALANFSSAQSSKSNTDQMYEMILKSVKEFKDKYETNPYVNVNGFSIDIGIPPSVNISFEFKPGVQSRSTPPNNRK